MGLRAQPCFGDAPDQTYLDKVDECDIFVLFAASELTDPVEREYARAVALGKRCLLFIKDSEARSERLDAWLVERRTEVKYARFHGPEDLADRIKAAVIDEVIKAHRRLKLSDADFETLATKLRSEPVTFMVRTIAAKELKEIVAAFPDLTELYPGFEGWVDDKAVELNKGTASAYVATYAQDNAGFALLVDKSVSVRKLATLYIKPRYQGLGVGPRLLYGVIEQAARDGVEKVYITVSEERRGELEGLLRQFGFFVEGVSGRRYRQGSWEWIWSKRLVHGRIRPSQVPLFIVRYLLEERGFVVEQLHRGLYRAVQRYDEFGLPTEDANRELLVAVSNDDPSKDYQRARRAASGRSARLLFVSLEPMTGDREPSDICLDALDLEEMFFPLYVERDTVGLIVPIREAFVHQLIPKSDQSQFLAPTRVQLRTENVYYRYPSAYSGLKRGSPLFFFETSRGQAKSRLLGEAKLLEYAIDEPEDLLARFGQLGVYRLADLRRSAIKTGPQQGKALALRFDWYREIELPLSAKQVQQVLPTFNPTTARRINASDALELRRLAGWNVAPLSFR